jgi:hypothetical protein
MKTIKFQTPFERLKFSKHTPESALRKAIIIQSVLDACSSGKDKKSLKNIKDAREWIFSKSDYFVKICEEAGIEPDYVVRATKDMLVSHANIIEESTLTKIAINTKKAVNFYTKKFA